MTFGALAHGPLDAGSGRCHRAVPVGIKDADGQDLHAGRGTADACRVVRQGGDDARHVGAMPVRIGGRPIAYHAADVVTPLEHLTGEVGVVGLHAGVEDGDGDAGARGAGAGGPGVLERHVVEGVLQRATGVVRRRDAHRGVDGGSVAVVLERQRADRGLHLVGRDVNADDVGVIGDARDGDLALTAGQRARGRGRRLDGRAARGVVSTGAGAGAGSACSTGSGVGASDNSGAGADADGSGVGRPSPMAGPAPTSTVSATARAISSPLPRPTPKAPLAPRERPPRQAFASGRAEATAQRRRWG